MQSDKKKEVFTDLDSLTHIQKLKKEHPTDIDFFQAEGKTNFGDILPVIILVIDSSLTIKADASQDFSTLHHIIREFLGNHKLYHPQQDLMIKIMGKAEKEKGKYTREDHQCHLPVKFIRDLIHKDSTIARTITLSEVSNLELPYYVEIHITISLRRKKQEFLALMAGQQQNTPCHLLLQLSQPQLSRALYEYSKGKEITGRYLCYKFNEIEIGKYSTTQISQWLAPNHNNIFDFYLISSNSEYMGFKSDKLVFIDSAEAKSEQSLYEVVKDQLKDRCVWSPRKNQFESMTLLIDVYKKELQEIEEKITPLLKKQELINSKLNMVSDFQSAIRIPETITKQPKEKNSELTILKTELDSEAKKFNKLISDKITQFRSELGCVLDELKSLQMVQNRLTSAIKQFEADTGIQEAPTPVSSSGLSIFQSIPGSSLSTLTVKKESDETPQSSLGS